MTKQLEREIEALKKQILDLGSNVKDSVREAVRAVTYRDEKMVQKVVEGEDAINRAEVRFQEECLKVMALHQPARSQLRYIVAMLKINNDLERVGDLAVDIAEECLSLARMPRNDVPFELPAMSRKVQNLLTRSLEALVGMDTDIAREVCVANKEIHVIHRENIARIEETLKADPVDALYLMHFLYISRFLKRIGDYATNISEDVYYMIEGEVIRHGRI